MIWGDERRWLDNVVSNTGEKTGAEIQRMRNQSCDPRGKHFLVSEQGSRRPGWPVSVGLRNWTIMWLATYQGRCLSVGQTLVRSWLFLCVPLKKLLLKYNWHWDSFKRWDLKEANRSWECFCINVFTPRVGSWQKDWPSFPPSDSCVLACSFNTWRRPLQNANTALMRS